MTVFAVKGSPGGASSSGGFAYDKSLPPPENFGNAIKSLSAGMACGSTEGRVREKGYAEPYRADGRPIWLVGQAGNNRAVKQQSADWRKGGSDQA